MLPLALLADGGVPSADGATWGVEALITAVLTFSALTYAAGAARLRAGAAPGPGRGLRRRELGACAGGLAALVAALLTPLDGLAERWFSVHMAQHELLMLVAAPLLVMGRPGVVALWSLPPELRRGIARRLRRPRAVALWRHATHPVAVFVAHGVALRAWHAPRLWEAALANQWVHGAQHLCFFGTAALFFWALVMGRYGRLGYGLAVLFAFSTMLHSGLLGALLTIAPRVFDARGVEGLEDQQLAGLIMWVPAGVVFVVIGLALFAAWLGAARRRAAFSSADTALRALAAPDEEAA